MNVVSKGAAILELLASEDQTLLIRGDLFPILNLLLDVLDTVGGVDIQGDSLTSQSLDEKLLKKSKSERPSTYKEQKS